MAATRKKSTSTPGVLEHLQHALEDLDKARHRATEEVRENIDRAVERVRASSKDLRERASERAEEWQDTLDEADESARRELARVAIRSQRTEAALTELAREIRTRKSELAASAGTDA